VTGVQTCALPISHLLAGSGLALAVLGILRDVRASLPAAPPAAPPARERALPPPPGGDEPP